jgi:hypothetical protein
VENYFNYFTEIEEHFRRCRGAPNLLSTLDWALIESWKEAGIPLEAVIEGIERSFEKFEKRPRRFRKVNSLAYCSQEVLRAAEAKAEPGERRKESGGEAGAPFAAEEIRGFLDRNTKALAEAAQLAGKNDQTVLAKDLATAGGALREIAARKIDELEALERYLTALEEKLTAALTCACSVDLLAELRGEVDQALVPYRRKISGPQIESLERQFLKKRLFQHFRVPRLSLFYL